MQYKNLKEEVVEVSVYDCYINAIILQKKWM